MGFQSADTICSWKEFLKRAWLPTVALGGLLGTLGGVHESVLFLWHQLTEPAESVTKSFLCMISERCRVVLERLCGFPMKRNKHIKKIFYLKRKVTLTI